MGAKQIADGLVLEIVQLIAAVNVKVLVRLIAKMYVEFIAQPLVQNLA